VAFNDRGVAYDHKGDHDRAITDYTEAIRLDPGLFVSEPGAGEHGYRDLLRGSTPR
jgi:Flp pilus assembly protein TadD